VRELQKQSPVNLGSLRRPGTKVLNPPLQLPDAMVQLSSKSSIGLP
jgi:hypothetical protein